MSTQENLAELITVLKQQRDELRVKMHLAGMETKEEYERLSDRINELNKQYEPTKDAAVETAEGVYKALKLAGEEMLNGFHKIRKSL
jgi:citrate lyase beta subunit